jgi:NADH-quinone oxidoreductase subunit H
MSSIAVYGVMLAGWASGSKYPLLGAVRASAQMISYEAAMGLSVVAVVLITGSLSTSTIVTDQAGAIWHWNLIRLGIIPFVIFLIAGTAELNRPPFDLVEAEQELVGGFNTEYASIGFALFYLAEFMNTVTMSTIIVTLFLGGPNGPHWGVLPAWLWPIIFFVAKTFIFLFGYVWLRATLPRFRYDQLMDLGWKRLIPAALAWLLILAGMIVGRVQGVIVAAIAIVIGLLLYRAVLLGAGEAAAEAAAGSARRRGRSD